VTRIVEKNSYNFLTRNLKEEDHLKNGKIILRWILKKPDGRNGTRSICLRIGKSQ